MKDALPGEGKVKAAGRRRRRHSHGVGVDGVEDHLRGSGWRLGDHIWGEESRVRAGESGRHKEPLSAPGAPRGTKSH